MVWPIALNVEQHTFYTITLWEPKLKIPQGPGPQSWSNKRRKSIGSVAPFPPEREEATLNLSLPRGECHKPCLSNMLQRPGSLQALIHGRQPLRLPTPAAHLAQVPALRPGQGARGASDAAWLTSSKLPAWRAELGAHTPGCKLWQGRRRAPGRRAGSATAIPPAGPPSPALSGLRWLASLLRCLGTTTELVPEQQVFKKGTAKSWSHSWELGSSDATTVGERSSISSILDPHLASKMNREFARNPVANTGELVNPRD